jgi:hypothetical protein
MATDTDVNGNGKFNTGWLAEGLLHMHESVHLLVHMRVALRMVDGAPARSNTNIGARKGCGMSAPKPISLYLYVMHICDTRKRYVCICDVRERTSSTHCASS